MSPIYRGLAGLLLLLQLSVSTAAGGSLTPSEQLNAFHMALRSGNAARAVELLSKDAVIYEQGFAEVSRDEWIAQQLGPAMAFARDAKRDVVRRSTRLVGDAAWVMSNTRTTVSLPERKLVFNGGETAILMKEGDEWKIVHLHWSAHQAETNDDAKAER